MRRFVASVCALLLLGSCTTDRTRRGYLRANAAWFTEAPAHPVVVVPGFGVTRLFDPATKRYVWGTPRTVVRTVWADDLDLPMDAHDRLVPRGFAGSRGPINTAWQLTIALQKFGGYTMDRDVYAFDYDWRLRAQENAARLDAFVADIRRDHGGATVDVVTHSAGGIVALAWVKLGNGAAAVRNLVLLGPPERGTIEALRLFARPERFIRRTFHPQMVATWPSIPELLPDDGRVFIDESGKPLDLDLWSPATWQRFGVSFAEPLARARAFRDQLRDAPLPRGVSLHVIAGDCVPTARRVLLRADGTDAFYPHELRPGEEGLRRAMFEAGDGTIPVSSAAATMQPQLFCDGHQGLASDPNVHRAIIRILRGE